MVSLLLKNIPDALHKKIKEEAIKHRRSMIQETITLLEANFAAKPQEFPIPVKGEKLINQKILTKAIKEGRN